MTVIEKSALEFELRVAPSPLTRREFHRQIARLEHQLSASLASLAPARRPVATPAAEAKPRLLSDAELEATRDALVARLGEIEDLLVRQRDDRAEARALLKRMTDAPTEHRWVTVTTKETGDEGCRSWQSVPVLGPIGMLGNWWRVRMSSGCP